MTFRNHYKDAVGQTKTTSKDAVLKVSKVRMQFIVRLNFSGHLSHTATYAVALGLFATYDFFGFLFE
jgi:hypothetical protein